MGNKPQKDTRIFKRVVAALLRVCLVRGMLPDVLLHAFADDAVPYRTNVSPEIHEADKDTRNSYQTFFDLGKNSRFAGRVWSDKSVFANMGSGRKVELNLDDDGVAATTIRTDEDFLHVFSALGSSQVVNDEESVPLDVVFVLDVSGSMAYNRTYNYSDSPFGGSGGYDPTEVRMLEAINGLNYAIDSLMNQGNPHNRVSVVVYSGNSLIYEYGDLGFGKVLLGLGRYDKKDDEYFHCDVFDEVGDTRIQFVGKAREKVEDPDDNGSVLDNSVIKVEGATNTQMGLYRGMQVLLDAAGQGGKKNTSWVDLDGDGTAETQRMPILILISDGQPTVASGVLNNGRISWWDLSGVGRRTYTNMTVGHGADSFVGESVLAIATASYYKRQVTDAYKAGISRLDQNLALGAKTFDAQVYTFGVDIREVPGQFKEAQGDATNNRFNMSSDSVEWGYALAKLTLNPGEELSKNDTKMAQYANDAWNTYKSGRNQTPTLQVDYKPSYMAFGEIKYPTAVQKRGYLTAIDFMSTSFGVRTVTMQHPNDKDITDNGIGLDYVDGFYDTRSGKAKEEGDDRPGFVEKFQELVNTILGSTFRPVGSYGKEDDSLSAESYMRYRDPIGQYMEVKDVTNLVLFGKVYTLTKDGNIRYYSASDDKAASNKNGTGRANSYRFTRQYYKVVLENGENPVKKNPCYTDDVYYNLNQIYIYTETYPTYADHSGTNDGGVYDQTLNVQIPSYALPLQVVTINARRGVVVDVKDKDGNLLRPGYSTNIGTKGTDTYRQDRAQSSPLRVIYSVGMKQDVLYSNGTVDLTKISKDYLEKHKRINAAGQVTGYYFYSNEYDPKNLWDYDSKDGIPEQSFGLPEASFSADSSNRFYLFQKPLPLYSVEDGGKNNGKEVTYDERSKKWKTADGRLLNNVNSVNDNSDYYIVVDYYEPATGENGVRGRIVHLSVLRKGSEFASSAGNYDYLCWVDSKNNRYPYDQRPAGAGELILATEVGGLRVGDMAQSTETKEEFVNTNAHTGGRTATAETYYLPRIDTEYGANNTANSAVISAALGNNGRLTVDFAGIEVDKKLNPADAGGDAYNKEFTFTINFTYSGNSIADNVNYKIIPRGTDKNARAEKTIVLTSGSYPDSGDGVSVATSGKTHTITFKLKAGDNIQFTGLPRGTTYKVAETKQADGSFPIDSIEYSTANDMLTGVSTKVSRNEYSVTGVMAGMDEAGNLLNFVHFTDAALTDMAIGKVAGGEITDTDEVFTFNVSFTMSGRALTEDMLKNIKVYRMPHQQLISGGFDKIELKFGEWVEISGLPVGAQFRVAEVANDKYELQDINTSGTKRANVASGTIEYDENTTDRDEATDYKNYAVFTNGQQTGTLSVEKRESAGGAGLNEKDRETDFEFTVTFTQEGRPYAPEGGIKYEKTGLNGEDDETGTLAKQNNGIYTFTLKFGQIIRFLDLPLDTHYVVEESSKVSGGYDITYEKGINSGDILAGANNRNRVVIVGNEKKNYSDTSLELKGNKTLTEYKGGGSSPEHVNRGMFSYTITPYRSNPSPDPLVPDPGKNYKVVSTRDGGEIVFFDDSMKFSTPGIYRYTIQEIIPDNNTESILYDNTIYDVVITVEEEYIDGLYTGNLKATAKVTKRGDDTGRGTDPDFENKIYSGELYAYIKAIKDLQHGGKLLPGQFEFVIEGIYYEGPTGDQSVSGEEPKQEQEEEPSREEPSREEEPDASVDEEEPGDDEVESPKAEEDIPSEEGQPENGDEQPAEPNRTPDVSDTQPGGDDTDDAITDRDTRTGETDTKEELQRTEEITFEGVAELPRTDNMPLTDLVMPSRPVTIHDREIMPLDNEFTVDVRDTLPKDEKDRTFANDADGRFDIGPFHIEKRGTYYYTLTEKGATMGPDGEWGPRDGAPYRYGIKIEVTFDEESNELKHQIYFSTTPSDSSDPRGWTETWTLYPNDELHVQFDNTGKGQPKIKIEKWQKVAGSNNEFSQEGENAPMPVKPGDVVTYRLYVSNPGEGAALNVVVTDMVPAGLVYKYDGDVPENGMRASFADTNSYGRTKPRITKRYVNGKLTWTIEYLKPNADNVNNGVYLEFDVVVPQVDESHKWKNIAHVSFDNPDPENPDDGEDESEEVWSEELTGDVKITKTVQGTQDDKKVEFFFKVKIELPRGINPSRVEKGFILVRGDGSQERIQTGAEIVLTHGQSATIKGLPVGTKVTVTELASGAIYSATVRVNGGEFEPDDNGEVTVEEKDGTYTIDFINKADNHPVKSANPEDGTSVKPGEAIDYEIIWQNNSDDKAVVTITDPLDEKVDFVSASYKGTTLTAPEKSVLSDDRTVRITYSEEEHAVIWEIGLYEGEDKSKDGQGGVAPGDDGKVELSVKVKDNLDGFEDIDQIENQAIVVANESDQKTNKVRNPIPRVDKVEGPDEGQPKDRDPVGVGDLVTYEIKWFNHLDEVATVVIRDPLDIGVDFVSATVGNLTLNRAADGGSVTTAANGITIEYSAEDHEVIWTLTKRAAKAEGSVRLKVRVNEDAKVEWTYTKDGKGQANPDGEDFKIINKAFVKVGNEPEQETKQPENPVPQVHKRELEKGEDNTPSSPGNGKPVKPGDTIVYEIDWQNYKSEVATVTITDILDDGLDFMGASFGNVRLDGIGTATDNPDNPQVTIQCLDGKTVVWTLKDRTQGGTGKVTLWVKVNENALKKADSEPTKGKVVNQASVKVGTDPSVDTEIQENPVPEVHKTETDPGNGKGVNIGNEISYEITWRNYYDEDAIIVITDPLDEGVDFVSAEYNGTILKAGETDIGDGTDPVNISYTGADSGHEVIWTLKVGPLEDGVVKLTVRVNAKALSKDNDPGKVINKATVRVNNDPDVETEEQENPVPGIDKTETEPGDKKPVVVGTHIKYSINWRNYKSEKAIITITDPLDEGLDFISASYGGAKLVAPASSAVSPDGKVKITYSEEEHTVVWQIGLIDGEEPADDDTSGRYGVEPGANDDVYLEVKVNEKALVENIVRNKAFVRVGNDRDVETRVPENPVPEFGKEEVTPGNGKPVKVGNEITYSIKWHNYHTEKAKVVITDKLDVGVDFVSASYGDVTLDGVGTENNDEGTIVITYDGTTVTWELYDREAGEKDSVALIVKVNENALTKEKDPGTVYNQAQVKVGNDPAGDTEIQENPVPDPHKTEETPGEDTPVKVGDEVTYKITYKNYKDVAAKVTITDKLDQGVDFVSASDGGVYKDGVVTWTLPQVEPGHEGFVTLTVRVNDKAKTAGEIKNQASVEVDNDGSVDTEEPWNPVGGPHKVEKTPGKDKPVEIGEEITYLVTWENYYDVPATVVIRDPLDKNVDFVSASWSDEDGNETITLKPGEEPVTNKAGDVTISQEIKDGITVITWTLTDMPGGSTGQVEIVVRVRPEAAIEGKVENVAYVKVGKGDEVETEKPENPVKRPNKFETDPGDGKAVNEGQLVTYEITYKNYKRTEAIITITDPLDKDVTFVSATDGGVYDNKNHTVTWTLPGIRRGYEGKVSLVIRVNGSATAKGHIKNQAFVRVDDDPDIPTDIPYNPIIVWPNNPPPKPTPDTGDNSNLPLWYAMLLCSITGLMFLAFTDRKKRPVTAADKIVYKAKKILFRARDRHKK